MLTQVGLVAAVDSHVPRQVRQALEVGRALVAFERALIRVDLHVGGQRGSAREGGGAKRALEGPLPGVGELVRVETGR